ncbi:MAG: hypothetical protein ACJ77A_05870 [Actinomycetota bacterium]
MSDIRDLLERETQRLVPPDAWEPVHRRARQRHRRRRVGAAVVALAVAGVGTASAWLAVTGLRHGTNERVPISSGTTWDGGRIVFQCDGALFAHGASAPNFCTMRPDGTDRRLLRGSPTPEWDAAWSPDGSRIAFRGYWGDGCEGCYDLYVMNGDGSDLERLTHGVNAANPSWSPDGSTIAFDTSGYGSIETVRLDGSGLAKLTAGHDAGFEDWTPTWSPDGERIAFVRATLGQSIDLWVMNSDGGDAHRLVGADQVGGPVSDPTWGPDGVLLAFGALESNTTSSLWSFDARRQLDGDPKNRPHRLVGGPDQNWTPEWIDGGSQLAFLRGTERSADLAAVRMDDGTIRTLIPDFPGGQFSFQSPPGGAAGACVDPGPPQFIPCAEALQLAVDSGFPGGAGSRVDVRLVHGSPRVGPGTDGPERWMWAVAYRDSHAYEADGTLIRQDYVVDVDAETGAFLGAGI